MREKSVESALAIQCVQIVTSPDMVISDEDLGNRSTPGQADHFLFLPGIQIRTDLVDGAYTLAHQQLLCACAIGADRG